MEALKRILSDEDEVDLTPMIDVTFLLLIYFMVLQCLSNLRQSFLLLFRKSKSSAMNVKNLILLKSELKMTDQFL